MILYNSITKKIIFFFTIGLGTIIVGHILVTLLINNTMFYGTLSMLTFFLLSTIILTCLSILIVKTTRKTKAIYKEILENCDPKKALIQVDDCLDDLLSKKHLPKLKLLKVMILFRLGEYEDAKTVLNDNIYESTSDKTTIILWEHNKNMIASALKDYDIKEKHENFLELIKAFPKEANFIKEYQEAQINYYNLCINQFDGLIEYYEKELSICNTNAEKVSYNANLAKIYSKSDKEKAKECIDIVLQLGNTMKVVEDCKKLLEVL
ncbi:MAG: hypothetical protein R3Y05_00735 [bacterium]